MGIAEDVAYLASEALEGRAVSTAGGDKAAIFILTRYEELGLDGAFPSECAAPQPCEPTPVQVFSADGMRAENLATAVPGADPTLRERYVVVGAHYDHLGWSTEGAPQLRRGADDNASGAAAVLELAARFVRNPAPATVLLAHFDAEELGLLGSRAFVQDPPVPLDSVALMVNLDMVGRLEGDPLIAEASSADDWRSTVDSLATTLGIPLRFSPTIARRSDHASFASQDVPSIAFFTGFHGDYHRPTDTPERLDYRGILRVVDLVESLVRIAASRPINER